MEKLNINNIKQMVKEEKIRWTNLVIVRLFQRNITQKDMAEKLNISQITIKRNIKELKENGYIERIGSKKTGYWKILRVS